MSDTADLRQYVNTKGRVGVHLVARGDASSLTRCLMPMRRMPRLLIPADEICGDCASTCNTDDAAAFLDGIQDAAIHAVVTDGFDGFLQDRHIEGIARVLRPGGHAFVFRISTNLGYAREFANAGLEFRGSIIRVASAPAKKIKKTDDLARTAEFFGLYRKQFDGTVAACLRKHQTGGLRRVSDERPFCDVIRTDDRDDFLAQLRRAALPLGTGTIVDPFRLRRYVISRNE